MQYVNPWERAYKALRGNTATTPKGMFAHLVKQHDNDIAEALVIIFFKRVHITIIRSCLFV